MKRTPLQRKSPLKAKTGLKPSVTRIKSKKAKPSKVRMSAAGEQCLVRVPGVCCGDSQTVVLAHLNGGGMGAKHSDIHGAYACSTCHAWLDGGYAKTHTRAQRDLIHLEAIVRTQGVLIEKGFIVVQGVAA
ncbi:nuclease domain-containing protein [Marinobacter sp. 1Y8]